MKRLILNCGQMYLAILGISLVSMYKGSAVAQVTSDGTVNTQVNQNGNTAEITGGEARGSNLFHSFQDFSVQTGNEAFFNNASGISNIFSRVTGGNISNIDGAIRANGNASLFLINPAGIVFGEGASLDIGGSFYGSTASSILFEDGEFSAADLENPPLLTVNAPIGLNLRTPQRIINRSTVDDIGLEVNTGEKITLAGGDIEFEGGKVFAPGGKVELGGLSVAGTIAFNDDGSLSFPDDVAKSDISLRNGALVDVRAEGEGFITINARNWELLNGSNLLAGIGEGLGEVDAVAGDINISATGEITVRQDSRIENRVDDNGIGNGGDIFIEAGGSIEFADDVLISNVIAEGEGNVGELTIVSNGDINFLSSLLISSGQVGGNITLQSEGQIALQSDLDESSIIGTIRFPDSPEPSELRQSGDINITAASFVLEGEGLTGINNNVSGRNIDPGEINLNVRERITIDGESNVIGSIPPDNELAVNGDLNIETSSLTIQNGGRLLSVTNLDETNSGIQGGDINIIVDSLSLLNGGSINTLASGGDVIPGDINIQVSDATVIETRQNLDNSEVQSPISGIFSRLLENSTGRSGNISLETGSLSIKNGGLISSVNIGQGDGGDLKIQVADKIRLQGVANIDRESNEQDDNLGFNLSVNASPSSVSSIASSQQGGNGGNIEIAAGSLEIFEGAQITSTTLGNGNAGNIDLDIRGAIILSGTTPVILNDVPANSPSVIQSFLGLSNLAGGGETSGNTGNITIEANSLSLSDSAAISTSSFARGNAGNIVLQIDDSISLSLGSFIDSSISLGGSGEGGDIDIETRNLSLTDGSTLFAGLIGELFGLPAAGGRGGNITIQAVDSITISGFSPNITTSTNFLNPSQSEFSEAGLGSSGVFVGSAEGTTGNPGTISLTTGDLRLADAGVIQASTGNDSNAGDITINANNFEAINGGQILAITESSGDGGNINLSIADELKISGSDSSFAERTAQLPDNVINQGAESAILALATAEATGDGGNITITSSELKIEDNGRIVVDSQGEGNGGTVFIETDDLTLNSEALISASTTAGVGGEIRLTLDDGLILRNNSQISAQAFGDAIGGNINIDSDFIVAFPNQNNDIIASAEQEGTGGRIEINTQGIFGIQTRPLNSETNDIDASGGIAGEVFLNVSDVNRVQTETQLPANPIESEQTSAQACQSDRVAGKFSGLTVKGKGGIVPDPGFPFNPLNVYIDGEPTSAQAIPAPIEMAQRKIQPARGIKITESGEVILTAYRTNNSGDRLPEERNCGQV